MDYISDLIKEKNEIEIKINNIKYNYSEGRCFYRRNTHIYYKIIDFDDIDLNIKYLCVELGNNCLVHNVISFSECKIDEFITDDIINITPYEFNQYFDRAVDIIKFI